VDIGAQGSSTCWAITAHKNLDNVNRDEYIQQANMGLWMDLKNPRNPDRTFEEPYNELFKRATEHHSTNGIAEKPETPLVSSNGV